MRNDAGLVLEYTFESFAIVDETNELAHAAAMAVAERPGRYNPLFMYGGEDIDRTHLLHAIGHKMLEADPELRIRCVTCPDFIDEFIFAVRNGRIRQFKDAYRSLDVLLIDRVDVLGGKSGTQEEFSNLFDTLHQDGKQIVLSSDLSPEDIPDLTRRLVSRFGWGMTVDLRTPPLSLLDRAIRAWHLKGGF